MKRTRKFDHEIERLLNTFTNKVNRMIKVDEKNNNIMNPKLYLQLANTEIQNDIVDPRDTPEFGRTGKNPAEPKKQVVSTPVDPNNPDDYTDLPF